MTIDGPGREATSATPATPLHLEEVNDLILNCRSACSSTGSPASFVALASAIERRCYQTWEASDLDERVALLRDAIGLVQSQSTDSPSDWSSCSRRPVVSSNNNLLLQWRLELCRALGDRSQTSDDVKLVEEHVYLATRVLNDLPEGHPWQTLAWQTLGNALLAQYQRLGNGDALSDALLAHKSAVTMCHEQGYACSTCLGTLGWTLTRFCLGTGNAVLLPEAHSLIQIAHDTCSTEHDNYPSLLVKLGAVLTLRADMTGNSQDARLSETYLMLALSHLPKCHPERIAALKTLGVNSGVLFEQTSDVNELRRAIDFLREGLSLCPLGHPKRTDFLCELSSTLHIRFREFSSIQDLEEAVQLSQDNLNLVKPGQVAWITATHSHADLLDYQFGVSGNMSYLEESIRHYRDALSNWEHKDWWRHSAIIYNLSSSLLTHYTHIGEREPLEEAILHLQNLLDEIQHERCLPISHPHRAMTMHKLADALDQHSVDFGDRNKLSKAIKLYEDLVEYGAVGFYLRPAILRGYAYALHRLSGAQALDAAVEHFRRASSAYPSGHAEQPRTLHALASALADRFELSGAECDFLEAMEMEKSVLDAWSPGHTLRAVALFGLARLRLLKPTHDAGVSDAMSTLCEALQDVYCHPQTRLTEALTALQKVEALSDTLRSGVSEQILEAYRLTIALLPRVAFYGLTLRSRLRVLAKANELAAIAAVHGVRVGRAEDALELLEEGRAVFWSQHLRLRPQLDTLSPQMSEQLESVTEQLRHGTVLVMRPVSDDHSSSDTVRMKHEAETTRMRLLGEEFERLLQTVRTVPGHERFLMPKTFDVLASIGNAGPVAVFVASEAACYVILLRGSDKAPLSVELPKTSLLDLHNLGTIMRSSHFRGRNIMSSRAIKMRQTVGSDASASLWSMWEKIMQPVFGALNLKKANGGARPRLFLCATGAYTHLPLHAASSPGNCCSHYCVISYTPTLTALMDARQRYQKVRRDEAKVLLAVVSRPFQGTLLHAVLAEAAVVSSIVPDQNLTALGTVAGEEDSASVQSVVDELPKASILHLACHGKQDKEDPLASGFIMKDKELTVAQLMELNLPSAFLAFLSACETAKGDTNQTDQAIHLAATTLYAGFKSVIGTMWSMNDADGPIVAKMVYEALFDTSSEFLEPDVIPHALDAAVSELRARRLHPSRWAPYIHIGM